MVKFTALMQTTSSPSARSTSNIPASELIFYKTYSPLSIGLFAIALFPILVAGTLIYYKDRCFCSKRKGDARLRQGTHLAEATNREQDLGNRDSDSLKDSESVDSGL
ncbi:hypothetical protein V2W45_1332746 [Cenococcum geophilum]